MIRVKLAPTIARDRGDLWKSSATATATAKTTSASMESDILCFHPHFLNARRSA
jgi:hypothetical protein